MSSTMRGLVREGRLLVLGGAMAVVCGRRCDVACGLRVRAFESRRVRREQRATAAAASTAATTKSTPGARGINEANLRQYVSLLCGEDERAGGANAREKRTRAHTMQGPGVADEATGDVDRIGRGANSPARQDGRKVLGPFRRDATTAANAAVGPAKESDACRGPAAT